jgi:hypothetical protein
MCVVWQREALWRPEHGVDHRCHLQEELDSKVRENCELRAQVERLREVLQNWEARGALGGALLGVARAVEMDAKKHQVLGGGPWGRAADPWNLL